MSEQHRPVIHFTPKANWINDPNGMLYHNGIYHLFFQYHPYSSVWGPMHWGHATSRDMIKWKEEPIAIYPDSLGTIFSGSAVLDKNNTSGFGKNGQAPLVAIFTHHNVEGEKAGKNDFQNQSLAYSNDNGKTWIKYTSNPVVKNPGIKDFRDPKVMWFESKKKWIMTLATLDIITFYSSPDLKNWTKESEFGAGRGAHGGVWECPDMVSFNDNGKTRWVLIVNLNPGGPNGGSGTQYFVGDFDGKTFTSDQTKTMWLDYGPDNYAGVTWSNTGNRKILMGWMSNWLYAQQVPTEKWRSAMTIARELKMRHVGKDIFVTSLPVKELSAIKTKPVIVKNLSLTSNGTNVNSKGKAQIPSTINLTMDQAKDFSIVLSNSLGEEVRIGFEKANNQYFIDRTKSGKIDFQKDFGSKHVAPRFASGPKLNMTLVIDVSSVELFADDGLTVMTEIFFPNKPFDKVRIASPQKAIIKQLEYSTLKK
ncbi:MAG TPA: glycoside hydrolase family 32 protein [Ferruginibacter sp.]|nr:glycoside hydrolase family 32 protein [Ferruginibacter sp.]